MFRKHEEQIKTTDVTNQRLTDLNNTLKALERFWAGYANFSGGVSVAAAISRVRGNTRRN